MRKFKVISKIRIAFIASLACVCIFMCIIYANMRNAERESSNVRTALHTLHDLESLLLKVQVIETGQRGYTISGDETFLSGYKDAIGKIDNDIESLNNYKENDPVAKQELAELTKIIKEKVKHSKVIVETRRIDGYDAAADIIQSGRGKLLMDSITRSIGVIETKDRALLQKSNAGREDYAKKITYVVFILSVLFLAIIVVGYLFIKTDIENADVVNSRLQYNATLLRNISDPIITTDMQGIVTNWNVHAENLYGFSAKEAVGKSINDLLKAGASGSNPLFAGNGDKETWKGEILHTHKNGNIIHAEVNTAVLKDTDDEAIGTVSVVRDVTMRKNLENRLKLFSEDLQQQVTVKAAELNHVFDRVTDAFIALDTNWVYMHVNKVAADMHNKKVEDLIGKSIWEVFPEVVNQPFYHALKDAAVSQQPQRLELYYPIEDKWYEDLIYPAADGISVYYHDITVRKKAELALDKVHTRLSYHINNTPLAVVEFDSEYRILQWSKRAEEIFGYSSEEVTDENFTIGDILAPEEAAGFFTQLNVLTGDEKESNLIHCKNTTKPGRDIFCDWYNSVLKDNAGNVTGFMALVKDVTQNKAVEQHLIDAEVKFRNLVEQSQVGVYILQDEKLVYINPRFAEIYGYDPAELDENFDVLILTAKEDEDKAKSYMAAFSDKSLSSLNYDFTAVKKDGTQIFVEVYGSLTNYNGKSAIIGTLIDITEKKMANEQLRKSEEALKFSNERFELISKATDDAVWDLDIENDALWGNERFCDLIGIPPGTIIHFADFLSHVHKEDSDVLLANYKKTLQKKGHILTEDFRLTDSKGKERVMYDRAYIIYNKAGRAYRMLGVMQDISSRKESERKVLLEKELSDSIINSLPGIFYLYNQEGQFLRWNNNMEKVTGYTHTEIKNLHPLDLIAEDEKPLLVEKINNVFVTGEDNVEADLLTKEGTLIPYYFTGMVIKYEGEVCLMGVGIDVSDKVKSEQELKASEEKFRMVVEQASDGIFISNEHGVYEDVNESAARLTGYGREELLGMHVNKLLSAEDMLTVPGRMEEMKRGLAVLTQRTITKKNGKKINVEISGKMLEDGRFQGIMRDVTERKRAEEALIASEYKYRVLFDQNPLPMWIIAYPERRFVDVNEAAILHYGYSREDFLQMSVDDLHPENELFSLKYDLKKGRDGIRNFAARTHIKKDGTEIKVNIISHDIMYENKKAILALANDITEKYLAEEKLQRSHEAMRELASHLENVREAERTHMAREIHDELGQQLTGLKMDIAWLNRRIKSEDDAVNEKMKDTIELIDKTVITVRRIATQLRPSILDDLGLIAAMEWQTDEFEKRSEIKATFISNTPNVNVSPDIATGLFRIFQESLTNVLRHSKATRVETFLSMDNECIILNIKDNGIGFRQEDISEKKTLGLLGMKERVLLINGTYEINGMAGTGGTSVIITVPLR